FAPFADAADMYSKLILIASCCACAWIASGDAAAAVVANDLHSNDDDAVNEAASASGVPDKRLIFPDPDTGHYRQLMYGYRSRRPFHYLDKRLIFRFPPWYHRTNKAKNGKPKRDGEDEISRLFSSLKKYMRESD
ncbi:PREDICTED: uncharacterized protein LOC106811790, partial [Priapulus caudatus]|uniref:Uncharacterized protein LOC106811790 n=1 Tax=Priapulus caudatus TaxID=37621 RepID=A0ABM1EFM6_PRICU